MGRARCGRASSGGWPAGRTGGGPCCLPWVFCLCAGRRTWLIFFPGTVVWDMAEMAAMQFGLRQMTTWHPVLLTWVFRD